jgi:hypothetical protein
MTAVYETAAASSQSRQQAQRIFAETPPMTRDAAAEHLKANGITATDGKMSAAPRERSPSEYSLPADSPVSGEDLSKIHVDPTLAGVIVRDLGAKVDPEQVKAHFARTGQSYTGAIGDVTAMLAAAGVKTINAASLSAHTLALLAAVARQQAKLAARPK